MESTTTLLKAKKIQRNHRMPLIQQRTQPFTATKRQKQRVSSLGDVHSVVAKFETEFQAAERQVEVLDKIIVEKNKQLAELVKQTIEQGTENGILGAVVEERKTQNKDISDLIASVGEQAEKVESDKRGLEERIEIAESDIQYFLKSAQILQSKVAATEKLWENCMQCVSEKEAALTVQHEKKEMINEDILQQSICEQEAQDHLNEAEHQIMSYEKELEDLQKEEERTKSEKETLEEEVKNRSTQLAYLQDELRLKKENNSMEINDWQSKLTEVQSQLDSAGQTESNLNEELSAKKKALETVQAELEKENIQTEQIRITLKNGNEALNSLKEETTKVTEIVDSLTQSTTKTKDEIKEKQKTLEDLNNETEKVTAENQQYSDSLSCTLKKLQALMIKNEESELEHGELKAKLSAKEEQCNQEIENLQKEMDEQIKGREKIKMECSQAKMKIQDTEAAMVEMQSKLEQTDKDCTALKEEEIKLRKELEQQREVLSDIETTHEERLREGYERKAHTLEEIDQMQLVLESQHLEMKELQSKFLLTQVELTDEDMKKVDEMFTKKLTEIETSVEEKYNKQIITLSDTLQRIKNEADVRIIQQQDSAHVRQLKQAAKLQKATGELADLEKEYNRLLEEQQKGLQDQLAQQRKEAEKLKKTFESERMKKEQEAEEFKQKLEEERLRKEEEAKQLMKKYEEDLAKKMMDSELIQREMEENKRMQQEEAESLKMRLFEEKKKMEEESEKLRKNHEEEMLKQKTNQECLFQKYQQDLIAKHREAEEKRARELKEEAEFLRKRHDNEIQKQKEELQRLLKMHEDEKQAQEKAIAENNQKQLKNEQMILAKLEEARRLQKEKDLENKIKFQQEQQAKKMQQDQEELKKKILLQQQEQEMKIQQEKEELERKMLLEQQKQAEKIAKEKEELEKKMKQLQEEQEKKMQQEKEELERKIKLQQKEHEESVQKEKEALEKRMLLQQQEQAKKLLQQQEELEKKILLKKQQEMERERLVQEQEKARAQFQEKEELEKKMLLEKQKELERKLLLQQEEQSKRLLREKEELEKRLLLEKQVELEQEILKQKQDIAKKLLQEKEELERQMALKKKQQELKSALSKPKNGCANKLTRSEKGEVKKTSQTTASQNKVATGEDTDDSLDSNPEIIASSDHLEQIAPENAMVCSNDKASSKRRSKSPHNTKGRAEKEQLPMKTPNRRNSPRNRGVSFVGLSPEEDMDIEQYLKEKRNSGLRKKRSPRTTPDRGYKKQSKGAQRSYGARIKPTKEPRAYLPETNGSPDFVNQVINDTNSQESDLLFASQQSQQTSQLIHQIQSSKDSTKGFQSQLIKPKKSSPAAVEIPQDEEDPATFIEQESNKKKNKKRPSFSKKNAESLQTPEPNRKEKIPNPRMTADASKKKKQFASSFKPSKLNERQNEKLVKKKSSKKEMKAKKAAAKKTKKNSPRSSDASIFSTSNSNGGNVDWFADDAFAF